MSNTIKLSAANSPTVKLGDSDMIRVDKQIKNLNDSVTELKDGKVDKENGKGLSSNDFTNEDKNKLDSLENYNDTDLQKAVADLDSGKEDISNKVTELTESCTDEKYPSAKAVKDYVDSSVPAVDLSEYYNKTEIDGRISSLQNTAYICSSILSPNQSNENLAYPNVKAIKDYCQRKTVFSAFNETNGYFDVRIGSESNYHEYRYGERESLTVWGGYSAGLLDDYIMSVTFSSGETPTVYKAIGGFYGNPNPPEADIYMQGTDCSDGVFTPTANKRYTIIFSYDGEILSGIVNGIPKAVSE